MAGVCEDSSWFVCAVGGYAMLAADIVQYKKEVCGAFTVRGAFI